MRQAKRVIGGEATARVIGKVYEGKRKAVKERKRRQ